MGALIMGMITGGIILFVITVGLVIIGIIKAVKSGDFSRNEKKKWEEETMMIREIFDGLSKMEKRVEALETILTEGRKDSFSDKERG